MQVFVIQSSQDRDIAGFTMERDGKNLPTEFAPWSSLGGRDIGMGDNIAGVSGGGSAVLGGIARDGFFLARLEERVTHIPLPPSGLA
jgi:hypothetical protein